MLSIDIVKKNVLLAMFLVNLNLLGHLMKAIKHGPSKHHCKVSGSIELITQLQLTNEC